MLYQDIDEVQLDVKIGNSPWTNNTITSNVYPSAEGQSENYYYEIPAQADGTNITVVGRIRNGTTWHIGLPMVIRVRDALGSVPTTPTTPTTTPTPPIPMEVILAGIAIAIIVFVVFTAWYLLKRKPKRRKSRKKK